jgi:hypothetical protein
MRVKILFAIVCFASTEMCLAQTFVWAVREGDTIEPAGFTFLVGTQQCFVQKNGVSECRGAGDPAWSFLLPVDDGRIEGLAVAVLADDLVLAYELTDEEANWGQIALIRVGRRHPKWHRHIGGLNLALPVIARNSVFVAALAYIARIKLVDGAFVWCLEREYAAGGYEAATIALSGKRLVVEWRDITTDNVKDECLVAATGKSRSCENGD